MRARPIYSIRFECSRSYGSDSSGGAGCDPDVGISGANLEEAEVNKAMLRVAREVILVADATKFDKRSMSRIASFSEVQTAVTSAAWVALHPA